MFTLSSIHIYPNCKYIKNLHYGDYSFGKYPISDFYGKNISLHVIVGKNGSGKSALLDIVFRMVNNVGAIICKNESRIESARVRYIRYLYADLEYEFSEGGLSHQCKLCIRDKEIWLICDDNAYWLSDKIFMIDNKSKEEYEKIKKHYDKSHFYDFSDFNSKDDKIKLAKMFFYTIATNYSMLGFQSADYEEEDSLEFDESIYLTDEKGNLFTDKNGILFVTKDWVKKKNWIDSIFYKNDGYTCPIVLNPYRDGGHINMGNEYSLTTDRLSALLIYEFKDNTPILDDYYLDKVIYNYNSEFYKCFTPIFSQKDKGDVEKINLLSDGGDITLFKKAAMKNGTWSYVILEALNQPVEENMSDIEIFARLFIAYEILNIAATCHSYSQYRNQGKIDKVFSISGGVPYKKLKGLVEAVKSKFTNIEHKFHQTLNFICFINEAKRKNPDFETKWCTSTFDYQTYYSKLADNKTYDSVEECMKFLPPGIFKKTILLKQKKEDGTYNYGIPFSRMSSGQRQMLYQMTTIVYHLLNLKSISPTDIHYKNINIVLDEIEVCFHPEYQREFLSQILNLLVDRLHLNSTFNIHFWLTTHSPFILSDVPEQLIAYMEEGKQLAKMDLEKREIQTPMAANISELLRQSFFLQNGFIGEFVRKKILDLLKYLKNETPSYPWDNEKAETFIRGINDPFIKKQLDILFAIRNETHIHK